ncbi:hypothetical protein [Sphingomonas corticis]|jgi:hypothetical protein|nr:hypothetical protein [Sphingomonas corticis]
MTMTKEFREELAKAKRTARELGDSPASADLWRLIERAEKLSRPR